MKYSLEWTENKVTSTGKKYIKATLKDETGATTTDVAIWEGFPNFANLKPGEVVEGDLVIKQNGQYENKSLYAPKVASTGQNSANRGGFIAKAQENKAVLIEKAQDNKERGIMTSSTIRLAVDTALAECAGMPFDAGVFKGRIREWRNWYLAEWDNVKSAEPFN
jgi:hypothetical protein